MISLLSRCTAAIDSRVHCDGMSFAVLLSHFTPKGQSILKLEAPTTRERLSFLVDDRGNDHNTGYKAWYQQQLRPVERPGEWFAGYDVIMV